MIGRPKVPLVLTTPEQQALDSLAHRARTAPQVARRARIVLACARGLDNQTVAKKLRVSPQMVGRWRARFVTRRVDGLLDAPRPGAPRTITDDTVEAVIVRTLETTPDGATHWADLLGQRIFGSACGHPDGNDGDRLADDPIHKLLLGRDPITGDALASQPTISRFENDVGSQELYAMGQELAMSVIERHQRRRRGHARRVTIDLDPTDDATHGAQQLTFFNKYYDHWCYLPLLAFLTFDDETEQYLCAAVLRPGNVPATRGAVGVLQRLLALLRLAFPQARFLVRLDGGFATPEIFDVLDAEPGLDYVVAMAKNSVLVRDAEPAMAVARGQSEASGQTEHVYTDVQYAAGTWAQARRVVIKAEVVQLAGRAPQDNPRFVVTNLRQTPRFIYERIYCARGDIENRIKELHDGLQIGRTSCCRFWANQLRVFFTAAAYVLMQELRLRAAGTACARTQVTWLRDRLLKLGAHVGASVRRIVLHLPTATPDLHAWRHIALALGARPG